MKTINHFFQTLLVLLLLVGVSSCSSKEEVNPILAARVEGTYTVSQIDLGGQLYNVTAETKGFESVFKFLHLLKLF